MKNYLLDTNIISYLDRGDTENYHKVLSRLGSLDENSSILSLSILTIFEYGVFNDDSNKKKTLIKNFNIEDLKINQEKIFAELYHSYRKKIGSSKKDLKKHTVDLLLASQAIDNNMILVSNDNIFKVISEIRDDFKYENWISGYSNT